LGFAIAKLKLHQKRIFLLAAASHMKTPLESLRLYFRGRAFQGAITEEREWALKKRGGEESILEGLKAYDSGVG